MAYGYDALGHLTSVTQDFASSVEGELGASVMPVPLQGRIAFAMIEYANLLDARDRIQLATALVKRLNTRALAIEGKSLNSTESNLLEDFLNRGKRTDPRGS